MIHTAIAALAIASPVLAITGGVVVPRLEHPYMASVRRSGRHACGGVLIDEAILLTTASCAYGLTASSTTVRLGLNTLNNPEAGFQESAIAQISAHPQWNFMSPWNNDLALLKLTTPVVDLDIATLPRMDSSPSAGDSVTVVGWGMTSPGGYISQQLRETNLPVIPLSDCQAAYDEEGLTDNVFCDASENGGKGACTGDLGGPVIAADGVVVGIISGPMDNDSCGSAKAPGVSVSLTEYLDWIKETQERLGGMGVKKADL